MIDENVEGEETWTRERYDDSSFEPFMDIYLSFYVYFNATHSTYIAIYSAII